MIKLFLAIISGILTGLSFDTPVLSFFVWFSLVPLLYILKKSRIKEGLRQSFVFGFSYFLVAFFWVGNVTVLGLVVFLLYLSFYPILFFIIGRYFLNKPRALITIPALWVLLELTKENIWCGFSWANLGYSQYKNFYLIQIADLFGVKFLSFIIVMVNVFIYEIFATRNFALPKAQLKNYYPKFFAATKIELISKVIKRITYFMGSYAERKWLAKKAIFIFLVILSCFLYSFHRLHNLKETDSIALSLVQPNISQETKQNIELRPLIIEKLKFLSKQANEKSLVIYPEAAWPEIRNEDAFEELKHFAADSSKDILIGAVKLEGDRFYNTALLLAKESSTVDIYRKIKIVPFGEYVPLREYLSFIPVLNCIGDMTRGREYKIFSYKDKKFSVLICFEDIFPLFVSRFAKASDFLINITDDSWFRGEPEASQHLAIMTFRAIENRISIARCANTGISGWVSFKGEINTLRNNGKQVFFEDTINFNLPLNLKRSLYNNWQEIFPLFCGLILFVCLMRK
ncbi:MAG: apolipoprotein N-acyltransferase [Candidatus Omnitrophota bacterium]|nr:apolipoprotein N-acyltransferase [Candidatus Omnitrophota bacterium]